jgi:glycosyltransferase involved in cell wall biosynthesis
MLRLAVDAVCSFSDAPLKVATNLGWTIALLSILYGIVTIIRFFFEGSSFQPGWASIIVVVSFLSGVQLITLGLIGEYIGRIYDEVKRRPLYLVGQRVGFDDTVTFSGEAGSESPEAVRQSDSRGQYTSR